MSLVGEKADIVATHPRQFKLKSTIGDKQLMALVLIQQNPKQYAQELIASALIRKKNFLFLQENSHDTIFQGEGEKTPSTPRPQASPISQSQIGTHSKVVQTQRMIEKGGIHGKDRAGAERFFFVKKQNRNSKLQREIWRRL